MKKVLFIANSDRHIKLCHIPYLKMFKDNGYKTYVLTNTDNNIDYCDKKIKLDFKRNPFSFKNVKALFKLRKIVKNENFDIISCHTPMGGFLGRSAIIKQKLNTKVFYMAHGFHFYKGCKKINWLIYYNIEKFLSKYSTCVITMNTEDYNIALNKFKCDVYKIDGIGLSLDRLSVTDDDLKKKLKLEDYFVVSYIAEISKRKNQIPLVKKLNKVDLEKEKIKVLLIGDSIIKNFEKKIKNDNIIYLDFKKNIGDYLNMSDLIITSSLQEGLPLCVLEAMYFNKYVIGLNIRGNKDLINKKNGKLVNNIDELINEIIAYKNSKKTEVNNDMKKYKIENITNELKEIYNNYLDNKLE